MHASWTVRTPPSGGVFGRNILLQRITCIAFASRPAFFHHIDCSKPKTIKDLSSAQSIEKFVFPSITRHLDFNLMLWIVHRIYLWISLLRTHIFFILTSSHIWAKCCLLQLSLPDHAFPSLVQSYVNLNVLHPCSLLRSSLLSARQGLLLH